jgi:hypothetical protein
MSVQSLPHMPSRYTSPVNQLLALPLSRTLEEWSIYRTLGITLDHLPDLLRMAVDRDLLDSDDELEFWAPAHAWRMLAILGTPAALPSFITVLEDWSEEHWDWVGEEIREVFGQLGELALPALTKTLSETHHCSYVRENAVMSIAEIGKQHPDTRSACVTLLTTQLAEFNSNNPALNGYLVTALSADLKAVESAADIEQAYRAGRVDEDLIGDWDSAQVYLGLKEAPEGERRSGNTHPWLLPSLDSSGPSEDSPVVGRNKTPKSKAVAKRKLQKQSRRQNRKKK